MKIIQIIIMLLLSGFLLWSAFDLKRSAEINKIQLEKVEERPSEWPEMIGDPLIYNSSLVTFGGPPHMIPLDDKGMSCVGCNFREIFDEENGEANLVFKWFVICGEFFGLY